MEFVVIVLFVAAILLVNFLMDRARKKRHDAGPDATGSPERTGAAPASGQAAPRPKLPAGASAETARAAAGHLDPEQHRQVYAAIAQGQAVRAVKLYAQFTGSGLRTASVAVTSLAAHPQPQPKPRSEAGAGAAGAAAPGTPDEAAGTRADTKPGAAGAAPEKAVSGSADRPADADRAAEPGPDNPATPGRTRPSAGNGANAADGAKDAPKGTAGVPAENASETRGGSARPSGASSDPLPDEAEISRWAQNLRPEDF